ncbi:MAG: GNAT family N-acetyltransferase [Bacteroidia bacterium]
MNIIAETERLILREWTLDDAADLFRLNANPNVLKFTGDKPFKNIQEAEDLISNYEQYSKHGLGRWIVQRKIDSQFLGWCGLRYQVALKETDIGFRFLEEYWNMGFAKESAIATIKYGFEILDIKQIVARCKKENTSSIKVLQKIGMKLYAEIEFDGELGLKFKLNHE